MYLEKVDIPLVPSELLDTLDRIEQYENVFAIPDSEHIYASRLVPQALQDYIQGLMDFPCRVRYQVIKQDVPLHTDLIEEPVKLMYMIDCGGDNVHTIHRDQNGNVLHDMICEQNSWYVINIQTPHEVVGVKSTRISLQVMRNE